jgi:hypothetical protein
MPSVYKGAKFVGRSVVLLVDGSARLFRDVDATGDLLKFAQAAQKISAIFFQNVPLRLFAEGVTGVVGFINARSIVLTINDLVSGKAAKDKPFSKVCPNLLKVSYKIAFLVSDSIALLGWLSSAHLIGETAKNATARLPIFGVQFNVLRGVADSAVVVGSALSIADTARQAIQEARGGEFVKNGRIKAGLIVGHALDFGNDASTAVSIVLANVPGVPSLAVLIPLAAASAFSLGQFFKKAYWPEAAATATG